MQPVTTRWRVPPAAYVPVGLAIAAEAVSNALSAYGLGTYLAAYTLPIAGVTVSIAGAVLVLAAIAISLTQARAAWVAMTPGPARQRVVAGALAALLLSISVASMASHILEAQRAKVAHEGTDRSGYDRVAADHKRRAAELAGLADTRTTTEVRAAMDGARVPLRIWEATRQCTDADLLKGRVNADACKPVLDLRQEMARAIRKAELEPEVARLAGELSRMTRPETRTESESWLGNVWAWIMGLGVVLVATFGSVVFARLEPVKPAPANDNKSGSVSGSTGAPNPDGSGSKVELAPVPCPVQGSVPVAPARLLCGQPKRQENVTRLPAPASSDPVQSWVRGFRARHGRNPMIPELQAEFPGVPKTTAWRRCTAA